MERFTGLLGIVLILGVAFLMSNNRKAINYRTVGVGLLLQVLLAVFILKTAVGQSLFQWLGDSINTLLGQADKGALFVFYYNFFYYQFSVLLLLLFQLG